MLRTIDPFRALSLAMAAVLLAAGPAPAATFTDIVVFGDSLSDVHNVYATTFGYVPASPPHYDGRFSNGPVWVETVGDWLGLDASTGITAGGGNYAYGGAKTGSGTTSFIIPNVGTQVGRYLDAGGPAGGELLVMWAGANDFFDGQRDASVVLGNLSSHIGALASAGGRSFLVANLPPLGMTPDAQGDPDQAALNQVTQEFNAGLTTLLDSLTASLGLTFYRLDAAGFFTRVFADPAAYGLTNVTTPAYNEGTGQIVPDPEHYLFWDGIHPTAAAHRLLGFAAAALVDPIGGDANRDGTVDVSDLSTLASNYRLTMGDVLPAANGAPIAAPEPASILLLACGALPMMRRRRGR